ncbi:hypothetical protein V5O48_009125 [Marasmius crinis-equi]|uniref:Uncharacterized protein n=1 Tax=Marasmius crinis-equi TaxID=585013 RepID=A0ABR3FC03_9AGAR
MKSYTAPIHDPITATTPPLTALTHIEAVKIDDVVSACPSTLAFLVSVFKSKKLSSIKLDWKTLKATWEFASKRDLIIFPPTLTSIAVIADPDTLIGTDDHLFYWSYVTQEDADLLYFLLKTVHTNIQHFTICSRNADLDYDMETAPYFPSLTSFEGCVSHSQEITSYGARLLITDLCIHQCQHDSMQGLECLSFIAGMFPSLKKFAFKYNKFDWTTEKKHLSAFKDAAIIQWPDIRELKFDVLRNDIFERGLVYGLENAKDAHERTLRPSLEWASEWALVANNLQILQIFMHEFHWAESRHCRHYCHGSIPIDFPKHDYPDITFADAHSSK